MQHQYKINVAERGLVCMAQLKCTVENCTYNKDNLCAKGDILIGGKYATGVDGTCCESFVERREGFDAFVSSLSHPSRVTNIDCEASKCIYNVDYNCKAEKVDIGGCGACRRKETACATFSIN